MNAVELEAEVRYRQDSCRKTFAAVAGSAGRLQTARDHLVAKLDAAVRRFGTNASDVTLRRKMDAALADLERYDDRTALIDEGTCPDCGWGLGGEHHPDDPCGGEATCSLCDRPIDPLVDRTSPAPLCGRCEGTCKAHGRLEQARIDEERGT